MYGRGWEGAGGLDEMIRDVLSVVAPHVEALEQVAHPLAALLGERLRRSLWRLEPLLDETLAELKALKDADLEVAACTANLRDTMREAQQVLVRAGRRRLELPVAFRDSGLVGDFSPRVLRSIEQWEANLRGLRDKEGDRVSKGLAAGMRALVDAKHSELRARMVLDDAHGVLRHALSELATVGRACEDAFPDVAQRVIPRPLEITETEVDRFDVQ